MLFKIHHLFLDVLLCLHHVGIIGVDLLQRLVLHVGGHIDLTLVLVGGEEVGSRHGRCVVDVAGHDDHIVEEGLQVFILHPEKLKYKTIFNCW